MISRLMTHDVVPIRVEKDEFGTDQETELNTEKGFFEYRERNAYDRDGNVIRSRGILFLKKDTQFDVEYEHWKFKDVKNNRVLQGEDSNRIDDPRTGETHHYEIELR